MSAAAPHGYLCSDHRNPLVSGQAPGCSQDSDFHPVVVSTQILLQQSPCDRAALCATDAQPSTLTALPCAINPATHSLGMLYIYAGATWMSPIQMRQHHPPSPDGIWAFEMPEGLFLPKKLLVRKHLRGMSPPLAAARLWGCKSGQNSAFRENNGQEKKRKQVGVKNNHK